ncbi:lamin tail domain-containing protein [Chryseobacterium sp. Ch-15]|uniref:Lamin tail domain-containing protein n=1 Tax=Chryseobacterium muglaense TaxID=2893752 RepID=A0A9Q3YWM8_9FLAO|nr:T9SS type A sorting domain-containing protein [Chryseobacterium muglaense]MBD3903043.1 lamin tail domain-containing protein [Chryseobacterium muglaense]MCC9035875.1 lamin tail domain-containing protein [Chryseobacterium muglaense]MCM2554396.1 lamin tail domain-containing protein [Chryseobacterium muglaense]
MKKIFTVLGIVAVAAFANAQIVINEVYGGGGNSGASYTHDFVELINRGTSSVTLVGASLQYAAAGATSNFNGYQALPNITLAPGQKYLIQEAGGANGSPLPTADFAPTTNTNFNGTVYNTPFNFQGSNGKVALVSNATQIVSPTDSNVLDFVGYGTSNLFEGNGAAPAPSNTTSVSRTNGVDTNNNITDFTTGAPTPQNSSSATLAVSDFNKVKSNFVKNTFVKNDEITFGADAKDVKVYTLTGQLVKTASVKANGTLNIAELAEGNYIVTGTVNNQAVSQKILKN